MQRPRFQSMPSTPEHFTKHSSLINPFSHARKLLRKQLIIQPIVSDSPCVGQYSPKYSAIQSNPKIIQFRTSVREHKEDDQPIFVQPAQRFHRKGGIKQTVMEQIIQKVDNEVEIDIRRHPKLQLPPLSLNPLPDNFVKELHKFKYNLQTILKRKL